MRNGSDTDRQGQLSNPASEGRDMAKTENGAGHATPEGRVERRRRATCARLLEAAYDVMTEFGVDDAKIKDITDRADLGFGTFYNYFQTKDEIAGQVLDCIIDDLARRNRLATSSIKSDDHVKVAVSMRIVMREATSAPMWRWWALRPDSPHRPDPPGLPKLRKAGHRRGDRRRDLPARQGRDRVHLDAGRLDVRRRYPRHRGRRSGCRLGHLRR